MEPKDLAWSAGTETYYQWWAVTGSAGALVLHKGLDADRDQDSLTTHRPVESVEQATGAPCCRWLNDAPCQWTQYFTVPTSVTDSLLGSEGGAARDMRIFAALAAVYSDYMPGAGA